MVEQLCQWISPRLVGEVGGDAVEVGDDALGHEPVDRALGAGGASGGEAGEPAPQEEELRDDLARREADRLALLGVRADACGERDAVRLLELPRELHDQRRQIAQLPEVAQPGERWDRVVAKPGVDDLACEVPGRLGHGFHPEQARGRVG